MRPARGCLTQHSAVRPGNKVRPPGESSPLGIPRVRRPGRLEWTGQTVTSLGKGGPRVDAAASDSAKSPTAKTSVRRMRHMSAHLRHNCAQHTQALLPSFRPSLPPSQVTQAQCGTHQHCGTGVSRTHSCLWPVSSQTCAHAPFLLHSAPSSSLTALTSSRTCPCTLFSSLGFTQRFRVCCSLAHRTAELGSTSQRREIRVFVETDSWSTTTSNSRVRSLSCPWVSRGLSPILQ